LYSRYEDGGVKVWEVETASLALTLNGHRSAVTALQYNHNGSLLVSGARDTDIIGTKKMLLHHWAFLLSYTFLVFPGEK
jgi:WD40 repeat protein